MPALHLVAFTQKSLEIIIVYYRVFLFIISELLCKNTIAGGRMCIIIFFSPLTSDNSASSNHNRGTNNTSSRRGSVRLHQRLPLGPVRQECHQEEQDWWVGCKDRTWTRTIRIWKGCQIYRRTGIKV